jgi:hypothetical protein
VLYLSEMGIRSLSDLLWFHVWWRYPSRSDPYFSWPYHYFNLFEGLCWFVFAGLVGYRYFSNRQSVLEIWYAIAFVTFGLTDFREAFVLESWLIWIKLANLFVLIALRSIVMRRYYPDKTLY